MELWIRSQHKANLCKVISLEIERTKEGYDIWNYNRDHSVYLGSYKTKERALEVLDEIQKLLMPQVILKSIDTSVEIANLNYIVNPTYETIEQLNTCVYEMPKD